MTVRAARAAGFETFFTTVSRVVPHRLDPFRVPQITVEVQEGDQFAALLRFYRQSG